MKNVLYLFAKLTDQDVDWLRDAGSREEVPPGQELIRQAQPMEAIFLVLSGALEVIRGSTRIAIIGPGESVGELSFLDSRPPSATVRALEGSVVMAIGMKRLRTRLKLDVAFASRFYLGLATMLAERTRSSISQLDGRRASSRMDEEAPNEIPAELLNEAGLAAARFDRMRRGVIEG